MFYNHELDRPNTSPMNTKMPLVSPKDTAWALMENYLTDRDLDYATACENGWYPSYDAGDDYLRVVIPALTHVKDHLYWQARAIHRTANKSIIRYQSPKGPRHDALVRVMPMFYTPKRKNIIVEGPMDALAVAELGYTGFALMGTYPSNSTIDFLITQLGSDSSFLILDRDASSYALRILMRIASAGKKVLALQWHGSKDIAGLPKQARQGMLDEAIKNSSLGAIK